LVLGALEAITPKNAPRFSRGWLDFVKSADYLKFLAANGYPLAPVEQVIIGDHSSDAVYADTLHQPCAGCDSVPDALGGRGHAEP
jgi:ParB family transcriptional regulator, chromosome partitioning protein